MYLLTWLILIILASWAFERFYLRGKAVKDYPPPADPDSLTIFTRAEGPGLAHQQVIKHVRELTMQMSLGIRFDNLHKARLIVDSMSDDLDYAGTFTAVDVSGVSAEWVVAPGADNTRRMLYIHGGGFVVGSPKSHRTITSGLSDVTGCAVLAIDYRLMPEYTHMDSIGDCRTAYRWRLENGPGGKEYVRLLFVAGDSAGGNLALALVAWVRDTRQRRPEAVVALSPLTDMTFSGASIRSNESTDIMLKPIMRHLNKLPQFAKTWWGVWTHKMRPANPLASPLLGDLSDLPPTLIQASEAEMLLDDARRYVYKACASGSVAKLQTWKDMVHVWQIFYPQLPQAEEAMMEIGKFLNGPLVSDAPTANRE